MLLDNELPSPILNRVKLLNFNKYYYHFLKAMIIKTKTLNRSNTSDIMPIYIHSFWCVSSTFKDIFDSKLKGFWLPVKNKQYFVFIPDNVVNALDKSKTTIFYSDEDRHNYMPWTYQYIENETFLESAEDEYMFTLPECYGINFCTTKFEAELKQNNITGYQLYKDLNFTRKDKSQFDWLRRRQYDAEGNCLE